MTAASSALAMRRLTSIGDATMSKWCSPDRKSTRLNSSHVSISYAVFCLKKKIDKQRIVELHELLDPLRLQREGTPDPVARALRALDLAVHLTRRPLLLFRRLFLQRRAIH